MSGLLAALRIARREAWRAKRRSALVLVLIGLPVAGLGAGAVIYDSFTLRPHEQVERRLGNADAAVRMEYDTPVKQPPDGLDAAPVGDDRPLTRPRTEAEIRRLLPAGSRVIVDRPTTATVRTRTGIGKVTVRELDYTDPIARGILRQLEGRAPRTPGEVVLNRRAAERTGLTVGDRLHLVKPQELSYRVVGLVEYPDNIRHELIVALPGAVSRTGTLDQTWLVDTPAPLHWKDVLRLNRNGMAALSRAVLLDPPPEDQVPWYADGYTIYDPATMALLVVAGGLVVLEIVFLAGPAFAIGARRRSRDLALIAVAGGAPRHLRWVVMADGVVLGLAGAVTGLGLGILAAAASLPLLEDHLMGRRIGWFRVYPAALAGIAGLAVLTGLLAALLPAIVAARQNVVQALSGRRGVVRSRRRWAALGAVTAAVGAAVAFQGAASEGAASTSPSMMLAGLVLVELGLAICTPALIGAVSMLGGVLPLAPRIALRTTSRIRGAAAPAVAAVMAAVAATTTVGVMLGSNQARQDAMYRPALPDGHVAVTLVGKQRERLGGRVESALAGVLPGAAVRTVAEGDCPASVNPDEYCFLEVETPAERQCPLHRIWADREPTAEEQERYGGDPRCAETPYWYSGSLPQAIVDDGSALPALTDADPDQVRDARRVLAAGGLVVGDPRKIVGEQATLVMTSQADDGSDPTELARVRVPGFAVSSGTMLPEALIVSPQLAERLRLRVRPAVVVAAPTGALTTADQDRVTAAVHAVGSRLVVYVERGPSPNSQEELLILAGISALITIGAAAIATGLVAADNRAELSTLAAVGATPAVRRTLMVSQAGVIAGLGTVLGALAGAGAAGVLIMAYNRTSAGSGEPPLAFVVPWQVLIFTVVVVPLVAMVGAGLFTRSRLPIERRLS